MVGLMARHTEFPNPFSTLPPSPRPTLGPPKPRLGWVCPRCEAVMAPTTPACLYCVPKKDKD